MATLNTSTNGPSIKSSYQSIVNANPASAAAAGSPTYGQWAVFSVQAPLVSAFQQDGGKESVLKVQSTGEGELLDLIDEFSEGRIQFAFVKVKDPNTTLPKSVLIGWCGEGVPERTKGYFTSHLAAAEKLFHGYHVSITARSDRDLTPEGIVQKVADSSGSKYSGGGAPSSQSGPPPPPASKPAFTPTRIGGSSGGFNPLGARGRAAPQQTNVDNDGWGQDAPEVTRTQLEKVAPAYKPTKVDIGSLTSQKQEPSRFVAPEREQQSDVVRGGYQPIGKVDLAAIRAQAKQSGNVQDDRPAPVKGSYEPVGKVDINAIKARAQGSSQPPVSTPAASSNDDGAEERPKSLAERSAAFTSSERMTSMPKPKVANKFGSDTSSFTGTRAPLPGQTAARPSTSAPIGTASKTFADEGGKTPAQIWAEKKARERGLSGAGNNPPSGGNAAPVTSQTSGDGGWKSGYSGKSWGPVQTTRTGQSATSGVSEQRTGAEQTAAPEEEDDAPPSGGIGAIRDRFKDAPPMGGAAARAAPGDDQRPPPMDMSSKPNAGGARGVPMPGLPSRPAQPQEEEEDDEPAPAEQHVSMPPPPARPVPQDEDEEEDEEPSSPARIAMPVPRSNVPKMEPAEEPASMPASSLSKAASESRDMPAEPQIAHKDPARGASEAATASTFGAGAPTGGPGAETGGKRAIAQYDYEKAEDNELELKEGETITNIDMVDDDWWMGTNSRGESGLFPSNYVELTEDDDEPAAAHAAPSAPQPPPAAQQTAPAPAAATKGPTATALYDYEAAEDNELSFPENATVEAIEFPDEDWWFGQYGGKSGLFPANYVQLDE